LQTPKSKISFLILTILDSVLSLNNHKTLSLTESFLSLIIRRKKFLDLLNLILCHLKLVIINQLKVLKLSKLDKKNKLSLILSLSKQMMIWALLQLRNQVRVLSRQLLKSNKSNNSVTFVNKNQLRKAKVRNHNRLSSQVTTQILVVPHKLKRKLNGQHLNTRLCNSRHQPKPGREV